MSRSREFSCVFPSLICLGNSDRRRVEVAVYRSNSESYAVRIFQRFRTAACGFTAIHLWLTRKLGSFVSWSGYVQHGQQSVTSGWVGGRYRYLLLLRKSRRCSAGRDRDLGELRADRRRTAEKQTYGGPKLRFSRCLKANAPGAVTACVPLRLRSSKFLQAHRLNTRSNDGECEDLFYLGGSFKCMIVIYQLFDTALPV